MRSARLIVADFLHISQRPLLKRVLVCVPVFLSSLGLLLWQVGNPSGFNVIWQYLGWGNQALSVFTLWMLTVYLSREHKPYIIALVPALFMTVVCVTFILVSPQALGLSKPVSYSLGAASAVVSLALFIWWKVTKCPSAQDR